MKNRQLEARLRQHRIQQNREVLWERLSNCLGSEAAAAKIYPPSVHRQMSRAPGQTLPALNIYPETFTQLRELIDSFWQAMPSDRWVVWVKGDYPEFVLSGNRLKRHLWKLVEAFEGLAIRKPGARSTLYLDPSENEFYASVRGKRWASILYDAYIQIAKRDYGWEPLHKRLPSRHAFVGLLFREQNAVPIAWFLEKVRLCLSGFSFESREMEQGLILAEDYTKQFVRIVRLGDSGIWCLEAVGADFMRRLERAYNSLRGGIITKIEWQPTFPVYE